MKPEPLKKRLMLTIVMVIAAIALCALLMAGVIFLCDSTSADSKNEETKLRDTQQKVNALQQQFEKTGKSYNEYKILQYRSQTSGIEINPAKIKTLFDELQQTYRLTDFKAQVGPFQELKDAKYKNPTALIESRDVTVSFSASSDEEIYQFISQLQQRIPGAINITKLSVISSQALSSAALNAIAQKGSVELVKTDIAFKWLGIKKIAVKPAATAASPVMP